MIVQHWPWPIILSKVICDRPGFHSSEHIYPIGFYSTRTYINLEASGTHCLYNCKILDAGTGPKVMLIRDTGMGPKILPFCRSWDHILPVSVSTHYGLIFVLVADFVDLIKLEIGKCFFWGVGFIFFRFAQFISETVWYFTTIKEILFSYDLLVQKKNWPMLVL